MPSQVTCPTCKVTNHFQQPPSGQLASCWNCRGTFRHPAVLELVGRQVRPPAPRTPPSIAGTLPTPVKVAFWGAAALATYKVVQALTDEEWAGDRVPASARRQMIAENRHRHGGHWCPGWGRDGHYVSRRDMQIDHRVALAAGGLNSRANTRPLCGDCNRMKGATVSMIDGLLGRRA